MSSAVEILRYVEFGVFIVVAALAAKRWLNRRGPARAWLAATFALLGLVAAVAVVTPENDDGEPNVLLVKAILVALGLFPYFLYRFMATFERPPRRLEIAVLALVVPTIVMTVLLPRFPDEDAPRPALFTVYLGLLLVEWVAVNGVVTARLWRAGRGQPTVARRRMRLLGAGAAAVAFALVMGFFSPDDTTTSPLDVVVPLIGLFSAVLFLFGFAPPRALLRVWRARDTESIQGALVALAQATSPQVVVDELLPRIVRLVGARGAAIARADGEVIGRTGETTDSGDWTAVPFEDGVTQVGPDHLSITVPGGYLELWTSTYAPYFGREEVELLRSVGALVHVTLERTYAHAREVAAREAMDEAQRIAHLGSWRLDLRTGTVEASDEMYRLLGLEPQSRPLSNEYFTSRTHPDDAVIAERTITDAVASGGEFTNELRIVNLDGTYRWLSNRGRAITDENGAVVALLGTSQDVTEARRLDRMRRDFVANAAHELRTPLTTVSGMATLLATQREKLSAQELDAAFDALGRQGQRARQLVTSLLDLSRLEAGRVPVQLVPTDVRRAVAHALETAPPPGSVAVTVDVPEGLRASADESRLSEILVNLLTNAYRYGGPHVTVRGTRDADAVVLSVVDDGPGVPEDFVDELFQPFSRSSDVTGTPGSGLGLTISHRLAAALGGELTYEPAAPRGACFAVRLRVGR
jgi:signal transduction histidine kinase